MTAIGIVSGSLNTRLVCALLMMAAFGLGCGGSRRRSSNRDAAADVATDMGRSQDADNPSGAETPSMVAGYYHTCALLDNGAVRCWGDAAYGQLGYGNTTRIGDDEMPSSAGDVNVGGIVTQIAAGYRHTCALLDNGAVRCWGDAGYGRLGYGNTNDIGDDELPSSAGDVNVGGAVTQIAAGYRHTCALRDNGAVRCWGNADYGQLGHGNTTRIGDDEMPSSAGDINVGGAVVQIAAGGSHTCALLDNGAVRCWGANYSCQLGYGNTDTIGDYEEPASVDPIQIWD